MPDRPKIVVLDGHATNPGDLSWEPFEKLGDLDVHPRTPADEVVERLDGATAALVNKAKLDADAMASCPDLKYVGVLATGYNVIDVEAAKLNGITVTNVAGYSSESTAQHAFALLLELTNHVGRLAQDSAGRWPRSRDWTYWDQAPIELSGLTCGVIGFGGIGRAFCRRARAFGMDVIVHTANPDKHRDAAAEIGAEFVPLDGLLRRSDVVSLHCPLTPETDGLIGGENLAKMKRGALLVNCGRGQLVDSRAVADALADGRLGGAGIDVLSQEPPTGGDPLLGATNCLVTPHVAWATVASRTRLIDEASKNLAAFLNGERRNVVA